MINTCRDEFMPSREVEFNPSLARVRGIQPRTEGRYEHDFQMG